MDYSELLKDPRWQKKRLEIMERDNFSCCYCNDNTRTLNVHHLKYVKGNPWEIESKFLITLCDNCHDEEHTYRKENELLNTLRIKKWDANQILWLTLTLGLYDKDEIVKALDIEGE